MSTKHKARTHLPDEPRWVETRDLLAWEGSRFLGDAEHFVVWSKEDELGSIVGMPEPQHMLTAAPECEELLAFPENIDHVREHLGTLQAERADIFKGPKTLQQTPEHPSRYLRPEELGALSHLPAELLEELSDAQEDGCALYAAFDGALPVAFCYVASQTESLWDVSIDTVASHRRQGFALSAAAGLIELMNHQGKIAVWGAVESNPASRNLAYKLGFVKVDELWVLSER